MPEVTKFSWGTKLAFSLVGRNPYPETDTRHTTWKSAAQRALVDCEDIRPSEASTELMNLRDWIFASYALVFEKCAEALLAIVHKSTDVDDYNQQLDGVRFRVSQIIREQHLPLATSPRSVSKAPPPLNRLFRKATPSVVSTSNSMHPPIPLEPTLAAKAAVFIPQKGDEKQQTTIWLEVQGHLRKRCFHWQLQAKEKAQACEIQATLGKSAEIVQRRMTPLQNVLTPSWTQRI
jgi:hypothetical protein